MAALKAMQLPALDAFLSAEDICAIGAVHPGMLRATQRRLAFAAVTVGGHHHSSIPAHHTRAVHASSLSTILKPLCAPADWFLSRATVSKVVQPTPLPPMPPVEILTPCILLQPEHHGSNHLEFTTRRDTHDWQTAAWPDYHVKTQTMTIRGDKCLAKSSSALACCPELRVPQLKSLILEHAGCNEASRGLLSLLHRVAAPLLTELRLVGTLDTAAIESVTRLSLPQSGTRTIDIDATGSAAQLGEVTESALRKLSRALRLRGSATAATAAPLECVSLRDRGTPSLLFPRWSLEPRQDASHRMAGGALQATAVASAVRARVRRAAEAVRLHHRPRRADRAGEALDDGTPGRRHGHAATLQEEQRRLLAELQGDDDASSSPAWPSSTLADLVLPLPVRDASPALPAPAATAASSGALAATTSSRQQAGQSAETPSAVRLAGAFSLPLLDPSAFRIDDHEPEDISVTTAGATISPGVGASSGADVVQGVASSPARHVGGVAALAFDGVTVPMLVAITRRQHCIQAATSFSEPGIVPLSACRLKRLHLAHPEWVATVPSDLGPLLALAAPSLERLSLRGSWVSTGLADTMRQAGEWPHLRHLRLETMPGSDSITGAELVGVLAAVGGGLETLEIHSAVRPPRPEAEEETIEATATPVAGRRTASALGSLPRLCPRLSSCVMQGSSDALAGDVAALSAAMAAASGRSRRTTPLRSLLLVGAAASHASSWRRSLSQLRKAAAPGLLVDVRGCVLAGARSVAEAPERSGGGASDGESCCRAASSGCDSVKQSA